MKALARSAQRAFICSLVQPSPQLLLEFDTVIVLSKGATLYQGPPARLLPHLLSIGYRLPPFKSWTEFVEEISGQPDLFFEPELPLPSLLDLEYDLIHLV